MRASGPGKVLALKLILAAGIPPELLARFDKENESSTGHNAETLKRTGLVMALAAWETYIKDRFTEEVIVWLKAIDGSPVGKFVRKRLKIY